MDNEQQTQVNEQPVEQPVNLDGVEIITNGEQLETSTPPTEEEVTQQQEQPQQEVVQEQQEYEQAKNELDSAKGELTSKGIDYEALEAEYNENGVLSKESYKLLEDKGYPKALVEAAIAGWQAKADAFTNKVIEDAGGKREYTRITQFVAKQGKQAIDAFNEIVAKSDINIISSYIAGIKAQMVTKFGTENPTLAGGNVGANSKGFADANEMIKAMSDPRYGKDSKYMKEVEAKVANSKFF